MTHEVDAAGVDPTTKAKQDAQPLFQLLLPVESLQLYTSRRIRLHEYSRAEIGAVTTFSLAAVGSTRRETSVALAADHLVAVELRGKYLQ